jgi:o-succinylbenzoate synthase
MRILDFKIYSYRLPLSRPLPGLAKSSPQREGFIIKLSDENGNIGYGETAPLPGVSSEMPDIVLGQLQQLKTQLTGQNIPANLGLKGGKFADFLGEISLAPSVKFGIETAILSLKAANQKKNIAELIIDNYQTTIPLNGLLDGPKDLVLKEAEQLLEAGFQTLKLKVGHATIDEDIKTVNNLTKLMNGRAVLRLDANKAWDLKDALAFSKAIDFVSIEYIEEPLKDFMQVPEFYEETLIPVAVDESLKQHSLREIKSLDGVETVILKPTIMGGFEKITHLSEEAHAYGLHTVITSTFESSVGLRALANLAACFAKHSAVGLDTNKWFKTDVSATPLHINRGRLNIDECQLSSLELDPKLTQEIS